MDKYTFSELLQRYNLNTKHIAARAGVLIDTIDRMQANRPVLKELAEKVLFALSDTLGQEYTLDNVDVNLHMIVVNQSEVARLMQQISDEYDSAKLGLQGLSQWSSKHEFMTAKQVRIADQMNELGGLIGEEATAQFFMNLDIQPEQQGNIQDNG